MNFKDIVIPHNIYYDFKNTKRNYKVAQYYCFNLKA